MGEGFNAADFAAKAEQADSNARAEMETVNIVITGSSGVGKSTLINAVFKKVLAKTAMGAPETMKIERITDPDLPLALYDTRGLEVKDSASTISELEQFIEQLRGNLVAADQLHVVWLCILENSNRVEPVHHELLALFHRYEVPCIVVLTQSQGNDEFAALVRNMLPTIPVVQVMAQEMKRRNMITPVEGLDTLVSETLNVLPEARRKAFDYCQKALWNHKLKKCRSVVNWATAAVAAAAITPIPGGHAAACIVIETGMLASINAFLGVTIAKEDRKSVVIGAAGIVAATAGGKLAFAEALKFVPGVGTIGGAVVGAAVAGPVCKMLGSVYTNVIYNLAKEGDAMPGPAVLIEMIKQEFNARRGIYEAEVEQSA